MITQSVIYTPYDKNPNAAKGIVDLARKYLLDIPGTELRVGPAIQSDRTVNISNGCVIKTTTWVDEVAQQSYFKNPQLIQYVREVLHGWRLEGDADVPESADAFIENILSGTTPREWERNACVPDEDVLWGGERIILHEWNK